MVHTGQNYDYRLNGIFFEDLGLRQPDYYLDCVGKDLGETMGGIIAKSYALMARQRPEDVYKRQMAMRWRRSLNWRSRPLQRMLSGT